MGGPTYAAKSWATHTRKSTRNEVKHGDLHVRVFTEKAYRESCIQAYLLPESRHDKYSFTAPAQAPALWFASRLDLQPECTLFLDESTVNETNSHGATALTAAVEAGSLDIM
ncbi:hypothetical protein AUP68_00738 [Ilyonectria robusta]